MPIRWKHHGDDEMAEAKWIKILTDIFDDEKILLIENLPESDTIIVIWFKLLCLAGKQNNSGVFLLNDRIAYTDKMLASIFRRKESTVQYALKTFEELGMIEIIENVITIPNWGKHQTLDKLEKKTEYMRSYMQEYRKKQRAIACKTNSDTNSKSNVRQADNNILLSESSESSNLNLFSDKNNANKHIKHRYGIYGWVKLTDVQYEKLESDLGIEELKRCIEYIDEAAQSTGNKNKWKDWNLVIRRCAKNGWGKSTWQKKEDNRRSALEEFAKEPEQTIIDVDSTEEGGWCL